MTRTPLTSDRTDGAGEPRTPNRLIDVVNLRTTFRSPRGPVHALNGVTLHVDAGEAVGIVGESGSGKSVTGLSILGLVPQPPGTVTADRLRYRDVDLLHADEKQWERIRGREIATIFQDPMSSLNPVMTIGAQLREGLEHHLKFNRRQARKRAVELLSMVGIADPASRVDDYPHQFSGGMRQRVMIAMALACDPKVIIADEPTTALDVTVQAAIVDLVNKLRADLGLAVLWITHDLGLLARFADRVMVMYAGQIVEEGAADTLYETPRHPYTQGLLASVPDLASDRQNRLSTIRGNPPVLVGDTPVSCSFRPRCRHAVDDCEEDPPLEAVGSEHKVACWVRPPSDSSGPVLPHNRSTFRDGVAMSTGDEPLLSVEDLKVHFPVRRGLLHRQVGEVRAVDGVSFAINEGETLGLVGESGCGKSTLARAVVRLLKPTSGKVTFCGKDVTAMSDRDLRGYRRDLQMIFQDPYASLNRRMTVGAIIAEPLRFHRLETTPQGRRARVRELLELVGLDPSYASRYPHAFSGGQRQRIGIARALAVRPKLIVCDEPISALDVSVAAQVVNLLRELQQQLGVAYLFIGHDLSMVRHISNRVAVMYLGRIAETADGDALYTSPLHPYTRGLLSAVPIARPSIERARTRIAMHGEIPSPRNMPQGCRFSTRCAFAADRCRDLEPELATQSASHTVACHLVESATPPWQRTDLGVLAEIPPNPLK